MERLDRFLVNISLLSSFSVVNASILPFAVSDHYPITLVMDMHCPLGPLPFKYNHIWSDYQAAKNIIQQTWGQHIEGSQGFIWENKLNNVKKVLKNWAKTQYNEPEEKKKRELKSTIEDLQCLIENQEYRQNEKTLEEKLYNQKIPLGICLLIVPVEL